MVILVLLTLKTMYGRNVIFLVCKNSIRKGKIIKFCLVKYRAVQVVSYDRYIYIYIFCIFINTYIYLYIFLYLYFYLCSYILI